MSRFHLIQNDGTFGILGYIFVPRLTQTRKTKRYEKNLLTIIISRREKCVGIENLLWEFTINYYVFQKGVCTINSNLSRVLRSENSPGTCGMHFVDENSGRTFQTNGRITLYCILYCILYCTVLYCTVLYCTVLDSPSPPTEPAGPSLRPL